MLALGRRLVERGHQVTFETWERWREPVTAAGIEFLPAPEYPVFPTAERPLKPYQAVVRATEPTRAAIVTCRPDVVVHDILTLAPALAAELEGVPTATLIPHLFPVTARGFPPYSIGARLPRTRAGRAFWGAFERPLDRGLRQGRDELNETRRRLGLEALERLHGGLSPRLCLVASFPQLEYPREWPPGVHVVGPMLWEPAAPTVAPPRGDRAAGGGGAVDLARPGSASAAGCARGPARCPRSGAGGYGPATRSRADQSRTQRAPRELDVISGGDATMRRS